jgi:hypothetical protein
MPEFTDGSEYSIDRKAQARPRVSFEALGWDSANLQPTLFRRDKQRVSKMVAVRRMNECVRGENRRQRNLLAAGGVEDADGSQRNAALLQLFGLGADKVLRETGCDRHVSVQTADCFLDA